MTTKKVAALFEDVRRAYFPRWTAGKYWRAVYGHKHREAGMDGLCHPETRTIFVARLAPLLMIHEVCHAVTGSAHGKKWDRRMLKALARAEELGEVTLARALREEVQAYQQALEVRADIIYVTVQDWVAETPNTPTLDEIVDALCREFGLWRDLLSSRYRRLPQVYDRAVRRAEQERRLRERFEALLRAQEKAAVGAKAIPFPEREPKE